MAENASFRWLDLLWFVLIVALAGGARAWYLHECMYDGTSQPPLIAQDPWPAAGNAAADQQNNVNQKTELDVLVVNLREYNWFGGAGPLTSADEYTAHIAPGYPFMVASAYRAVDEDRVFSLLRWVQCALGALTAGFYFFFARRAFRSLSVALLAGLFCAFNPFWIINTGEINDGVLTAFLLASCIMFGTRGSEVGGPFSSLVFGLALAGLCLVRAVMLPFAFIGILWFLWKCRIVPRGWLCAILGLLGFANGVAAWTVHNYQRFNDVIPMADSAFVHLYKGNNAMANGGPQNEQTMRATLGQPRVKEILAGKTQSKRYQMLSQDTLDYVKNHPAEAVRNRVWAGLYFYFGQGWFMSQHPASLNLGHNQQGQKPPWINTRQMPDAEEYLPKWLLDQNVLIVNSVLLGMLVLALLGWRWTFAWHQQAGLAALAALLIPLPYILSHADELWGPRLPLDGVLLSFAAFAIIYMIPGFRAVIARGPDHTPMTPDEM